MKSHSTNYINTFIEIAEDCPTEQGVVPPLKREKKSIANFQFNMIYDHPYQYTSDDVFFKVHAIRKDLIAEELESARMQFFSKGQACFRASPLTKRYGWGVHSDSEGKIAIYACESEEYQNFIRDPKIKKVKAMRSKRK